MTTGRGSSPASKANLKRGPQAGLDPAAGGRAKAAKAAERKAEQEGAAELFSGPNPLDGLEFIIAEAGANVAYLLQEERRGNLDLNDSLTKRLSELRQVIAAAQHYRDQMQVDTPAEQIADAIAARFTDANFSELSPARPDAA